MKLLSAIFREEISDYTYPFPKQSFLRIFALLIVSGAVVWVLALAFDKLMIGPVFCSNTDNVSICANSTTIASYVALVLTGVLLVPLLAVFGVKRPLLVVVAANDIFMGNYIMDERFLDIVNAVGVGGNSASVFGVNLAESDPR